MEISNRVTKLIEQVDKNFSPISIFIYGSRARGDHNPDSDYEIGVLWDNEKITRQSLAELNNESDVNLYPYEYAALCNQKIDTPFPPTLFLYELTQGGAKTVSDKQIIETIPTPKIEVKHIVARINFDVAVALTAMLTARSGESKTAPEHFYKSCLLGGRCLTIAKNNDFPKTYQDIAHEVSKLDIGDHSETIKKALATRSGDYTPSTKDYYDNIAFLTRIVRDEISNLQDANQILL